PPAPVQVAFKADERKLGEEKGHTACALDTVAGAPATDEITVGRDASLPIVGWAADPAGTVPPVVTMELVGPHRYFVALQRITKRPDVAEVMKAPALVDSGYDALVSFSAVEPGTYSVHVTQVTSWADVLGCDTRRKIKVQ
ncbi:MAG TPA: hypothetical protein VHE30_11780, partial [Polyangiaceae bacterium]|nr:hypothetical protein [Polyangiaceae bacterium]